MEKSKISDQELNKVSGGRDEYENYFCTQLDKQTFEFHYKRGQNNECPRYIGSGHYPACSNCFHIQPRM